MNSTKKIVLVLILVFIAVCSLVIYNAFFTFDRKYTLLISDQYNVCWLISNDYSFEVTSDGFIYRGGKNTGHFTLKSISLSPNLVIRDMNGFRGGEIKEPNYRNYEYQVFDDNPELILHDKFEYVAKAPFHIFPRRNDCEELKKVNKKQVRVFDE